MALVVEDGTGKADANSYLSAEDATAYLTVYATAGNLVTWTASAAKDAALMVATQYLDNEFAGQWRGVRTNETQALAWPRDGVEDDDGFGVDDDAVPQKLQDACAELALRVVLGDSLHPVETSPGAVQSESITVGPVSKSKTYAGSRPTAGYGYPKVHALIRSLLQGGGRVFRA